MADITKKELFDEAKQRTDLLFKKEDIIIKKIQDAALSITLITLCAYVVLYSYKANYYKVFNIPSSCVRVELNDFLPMLYSLAGCAIYLIWYLVSLNSDKVLNRKKYNFLRVLYGYAVIDWLLGNRIGGHFPVAIRLFVPFVISFFVELIVFLIRRIKIASINETVKDDEKDHVFENLVFGIFVHRYLNMWVCIIIVLQVLSTLWGGIVARSITSFTVFNYADEKYTVIVNYDEAIIAQRVNIEDESIIIDANSYTYLNKDGLEFSDFNFRNVIIDN